MRHALATLSLVTSLALAQSPTTIPLLHPDVIQAYNRSGEAAQSSDYQLALALLEGSLYTEGVRVAVEGDHAERRAIVSEAIAEWSRVLEGDNPVRLVSANEDYDLLVRYVTEMPTGGSACSSEHDHSLGLIKLQKRYRWNRAVREVTISGGIYVSLRPRGGALSRAEQLDVILHELGHLLGLDDRNQVGPLMGPLERGNPSGHPAADEVRSIVTFRRLVRDRISVINTVLQRRTSNTVARNQSGQ
ncbi:MAG: hypothetical protein KF812_05965 [Fimbriimonadaceae bacterium]|nr:hypothetical protein [Fimbriimonadaceae bacterium]